MSERDLRQAKRLWGDHVEDIIGFSAVAKDVTSPIRFGDIVHLHGGTYSVVRVPDQGTGWFSYLKLAEDRRHLAEPDRPKVIATQWSRVLRVVGTYKDLPHSVKRAIEPCRAGVVLNGMHWDLGVRFLDDEAHELFRKGAWTELNSGDQQNVSAFFGVFCEDEARQGSETYRVLVHTDAHWNTWKCFGPMAQDDVDETIAKLDEQFSAPRQIRRGVYEVGAETMSKYEIYRGYEKIDQRRFYHGHGEDERPLNTETG